MIRAAASMPASRNGFRFEDRHRRFDVLVETLVAGDATVAELTGLTVRRFVVAAVGWTAGVVQFLILLIRQLDTFLEQLLVLIIHQPFLIIVENSTAEEGRHAARTVTEHADSLVRQIAGRLEY